MGISGVGGMSRPQVYSGASPARSRPSAASQSSGPKAAEGGGAAAKTIASSLEALSRLGSSPSTQGNGAILDALA
jgi:hypothetical protein